VLGLSKGFVKDRSTRSWGVPADVLIDEKYMVLLVEESIWGLRVRVCWGLCDDEVSWSLSDGWSQRYYGLLSSLRALNTGTYTPHYGPQTCSALPALFLGRSTMDRSD